MQQIQVQNDFSEQLAKNQKIVFPAAKDFSTRRFPKVIGKLWNYWCLAAAGLLILIFAPPVMLYGRITGNYKTVQRWAMWGAAVWLKMCGVKTVLRGVENVKQNETYVFVSNHRSYLETAVVEAHLGRHVGIISKKELLKLPIAGRLMSYIDMLAIDRSNPARAVETMNEAAARIKNGLSVVVFAEGTRAMPNELLPFKKGAFHLAIESGAKILPVAVYNSDKLMGKKQSYAEPGTVTIDLLPAIETGGLNAETDLEMLRDRTRAAIATALAKK